MCLSQYVKLTENPCWETLLETAKLKSIQLNKKQIKKSLSDQMKKIILAEEDPSI